MDEGKRTTEGEEIEEMGDWPQRQRCFNSSRMQASDQKRSSYQKQSRQVVGEASSTKKIETEQERRGGFGKGERIKKKTPSQKKAEEP